MGDSSTVPPVGSIVRIYTRHRHRTVRIISHDPHGNSWGIACSATGVEYKNRYYFGDHQIQSVIVRYDPLVQFVLGNKIKPIGTKARIKRD